MFKNLSDKPIGELQKEQAKHWYDTNLLQKTVDNREGQPTFIWYEGPPTANGKPGIHHVLSRTLKDSICRYKVMKGYKSERRAGWDNHGLPVEIEVEKKLGFNGKQDIENYGIEKFNQKCRESVFEYESLWQEMSYRMGFFADMDHPYKTLDNDYIESEWWILRTVFDRGLIYEGHKVLPYCPRCGTGLASHEVAQGYKEVPVLTLTMMFKRKDADDEYFLAWTTTPWTVIGNLAVAMNPDLDYVRAKMTAGPHKGKTLILAARHADEILGEGQYEVLETLKGKEFEYVEYERLMDFDDIPVDDKAFYVILADYVTDEDGTGIVHTAPAYGEEDYDNCMEYGLPMLNPVDLQGKYTAGPWKGEYVMEDGLDLKIMKWIADQGRLFAKQKITHDYPHCWRCGTPLLYYAKPSWYIKMTDVRDELVANNNATNWYPEFVGEKRFGNWLENVKDWAISRNRYWGMPIPIWRCEKCGKVECMGSRQELIDRAQEDIDMSIDLHRPYVDEVHLTCPDCGGTMTRIPEVIDCWFDSGSMPYAQWHYPFEHKDDFGELFPADYICEGIDQTRGWFYSLMAVSTLIMHQSPYRNVLVGDLILDKDGKKMSKSKGNTVDPFEMFDKYGADTVRWYLMQGSPAWLPTKFDEDGMRDNMNKFFGTLKNVYNFFVLYANLDDIDPKDFEVDYESMPELDKWILSKYNKTVKTATEAMDEYYQMKAARAVQDFVVEDLSNWYIRRARRRFWAPEMTDDKKSVFKTTYDILVGVTELMAPIAPFLSDEMYVDLTGKESVHLADYPVCDESRINEHIEERMDLVRELVSLGRGAREKQQIKVRQPLSEVLVDGKYESLISDLTPLIMEELNVKEVRFENDLSKYMNYTLKPDYPTVGPMLGAKIKTFAKLLAEADTAEFVKQLNEEGSVDLDIEGETFRVLPEYVDVRIDAKEGFAVASENNLFTILDTELTDELVKEGFAREIVSKVQQMRKQKDFEMMDRIELGVSSDADVEAAVSEYKDYITEETLAESLGAAAGDAEDVDINGHAAKISVKRI
ncbi:MAG: isoleucine--tRNA ligase [Anaerovoracaceae bacterium]|jgi:isoleucyl-tRNA synthetase